MGMRLTRWRIGQMALCNPNPKVMDTFARAGLPDLIGMSWYFVRVHDAVQVCLSHLQGENPFKERSSNTPPPRKRSSERWGQQQQEQDLPSSAATMIANTSPWRREHVSHSESESLLTNTDDAV